MNQSDNASQTKPAKPLPCRGCMADCPNRSKCAGKPWRMPAS